MDKTNLIFLDTETTGRGQDDRLCQVAYRFGEEEREGLFKPPVPIEIEAMSVTHITNKMVEDKEPFVGSDMHAHLGDLFSRGLVMVAHNAQFDAEMLEKEGLRVGRMIDTFKVAHRLDESSKIPRYNLQYLRYFFDLNVENVVPHSALGDVLVLEKLFEHLFREMAKDGKDEEAIFEEMMKVSSEPILMKKFPFGKYNGQRVTDVARIDPGYLNWLLNQKIEAREREGENDENWIYTLEHHLKVN